MNQENPRFAPLPVRARTTLEILDTAVKLYRRYFGILTLWSLIVSATYLVSAVVPFAYLIAMPLVYGSVSCAIAAAVRGEPITFAQVWNFTQPRFGALLGVLVLSILILSAISFVLVLAGAMIFGFAAVLLANLPEPFIVVGVLLGIVLSLVAMAALGTVAFGWMSMAPIVACLEDDKRGVAALGRAWSLLAGAWRRVFVISSLLGISFLVVFGIIAGFAAMIAGGLDTLSALDESAWLAFGVGATVIAAIFLVAWTPAQSMVVGVLYLDLRVRKEALDLEWNNYQTGEPLPDAPRAAPPQPATPPPPAPLQNGASPETTGAFAGNSPGPEIPLGASALGTAALGASALGNTAPVSSFSGQSLPADAAFSDAAFPDAATSADSAPPVTLDKSRDEKNIAPAPFSSENDSNSSAPAPFSSFAPPEFSLDSSSPSPNPTPEPSENRAPDSPFDLPSSFDPSPSFDSGSSFSDSSSGGGSSSSD